VYQFSSEILADPFVSDGTFGPAVAVLGEQGIAARIGSLGNVSMLAMLLNACQVDLQPVEPPFPDVRGFARVPAERAAPRGWPGEKRLPYSGLAGSAAPDSQWTPAESNF